MQKPASYVIRDLDKGCPDCGSEDIKNPVLPFDDNWQECNACGGAWTCKRLAGRINGKRIEIVR